MLSRSLLIVPLAALAGCATSGSGLAKTDVETVVASAKAPQAFASCVVDRLNGVNRIHNDGDHYWVLRLNGYGIPMARWDFTPTGAGSRAELRASVRINAGENKVRDCA